MKVTALLVGVLVGGLTWTGGPRVAPVGAAPLAVKAPKLVVLIAVDQMRADYIETYGKQWQHGLRRMVDHGAWFTRAAYPYLGTVTCPGHATLGTGAYPASHGMIQNGWWDRGAAKIVACTEDGATTLLSYGTPIVRNPNVGDSAKNLLVPTLADEMRRQLSPPPRVVSMSMKARAAINLAGHQADAVTWFEGSNWVTSTAYTNKVVGFIKAFIDANPLAAALATPWQLLREPSAYLHVDDAADEKPPFGWGKTFPHPLSRKGPPLFATTIIDGVQVPSPYWLWEQSPAADHYLVGMGSAAVAALKLGQGAGTDYLAISFSTLDRVGHAFGPRSHEIQDVLLRLDLALGELLTDLDKRVGPDGYVVGFSADHGVATLPEQSRADGVDAGRIALTQIQERLNAVLGKVLGPGSHVLTVQYSDIYLAPGVYARIRQRPEVIKDALDALRTVPGVLQAFASDDISDRAQAARLPDPLRRAAALSYFAGRSGDFVFVPKPHWIAAATGTTHGSQNDYDQRVPVILLGARIKPGKYDRPVSPADLSPTLARLCGIQLPHAEGQPLVEALRK